MDVNVKCGKIIYTTSIIILTYLFWIVYIQGVPRRITKIIKFFYVYYGSRHG